jgi:hypothetical protein
MRLICSRTSCSPSTFDRPQDARAAGNYQDLALFDREDVAANIFTGREKVRRFFVYGDWASDCCWVARVKRPSPSVLRVRFAAFGDDTTYPVQAVSRWMKGDDTLRDRTRRFELG